MILTEEIQTTFEIDKSSWTKVKLRDVVREVRETVKDPVAEGIERIVGLEHLEPESLHIRTWGTLTDGTTFTKVFRKGQVLFGRRRAYLKKAALATFDGICSGDITVLEAKKSLLPELLPFLIQNEKFFDLAVKNSAGSLSPRAKFKDLADFEFLLPPKDQQDQIAELLMNCDDVVEKAFCTEHYLVNLKDAIHRKYFEDALTRKIKISECAKVFSGGTPDRKNEKFWGGDIPWAKTAEVNYCVITDTEEKITELGLRNSAAKLVKENSILVAMYGQGVTRGRVAITGIPLTCNQACAVIEPFGSFLPEFIYSYLEYRYEDLRSLAHGANQQNLNLNMIKAYAIPDFDLETQSKIIYELKAISFSRQRLYEQIHNFKKIATAIINQIF